MNVLSYITTHPEKDWNWYCISKHEKVTWEFIRDNLKSETPYPWSAQGLAHNPNITYEIIVENFDLLKNKICLYSVNAMKKMNFSSPEVFKYIVSYECLNSNIYLDFDFVEKCMKLRFGDWDWKCLSKNPNITKKFIDKNLDKLYIKKLIKNSAFTYEMLEQLLQKIDFEDSYDLYNIPKNPNFDIKWYHLVKKYNINMSLVVKHKNITMRDIIDNNLTEHKNVVGNPNITLDYIVKYLDKYKEDNNLWYALSKNPGITWNMMCQTKDRFPWVARYITYNPNINWDIIKKNPKLDWDWEYISMKFKIPEDDFTKFPIDFNHLSMNPNINWDIVNKYSDKSWNWKYLVTNPMII